MCNSVHLEDVLMINIYGTMSWEKGSYQMKK